MRKVGRKSHLFTDAKSIPASIPSAASNSHYLNQFPRLIGTDSIHFLQPGSFAVN